MCFVFSGICFIVTFKFNSTLKVSQEIIKIIVGNIFNRVFIIKPLNK